MPVELGGVRGGPDVRTLRRDRWWRSPAATVAFLTVVVVYATWAVFQNSHYYVGAAVAPRPHLALLLARASPAAACPAHGGSFALDWWTISPGAADTHHPARVPGHLLLLPQGLLPGLLAVPAGVRGGRRPRSLHAARRASRSSSRTCTATSSARPDLERDPHHRRRHGLPPARRRRHRRERGHARARGQRRLAVAATRCRATPVGICAGATSTGSPSTRSATGCGSSPRRSTPGTCRSPGPA